MRVARENKDSSPEELVRIGEYLKPAEAVMLAAQLKEQGIDSQIVNGELSTMLSWYGTAVGGARLLVARENAAEANLALTEVQARIGSETGSPFPEDFDFGDDTQEETTDEPSDLNGKQMARAFNGAIVGLMLAPLFVWVYSAWLIFRHSLWKRSEDWRLYVTLFCILFGFVISKWYYGI